MKLSIRKSTKIWKCKDGTKVRICDMTDSHLKNTIKLIEKNAVETRTSAIDNVLKCLAFTQGEAAQDLLEKTLVDLESDLGATDFLSDIYNDMMNELERRKLSL